MSITTPTDRQESQPVIECGLAGCEAIGRPWTMQHGFCEREHWERHRGRQALAALKCSHTVCFSCFSELKTIEPPKPATEFRESGAELTYNADEDRLEVLRYGQEIVREAACGYQYRTPEATIDEKPAKHGMITGTVCAECGSTSHTEHIALLPELAGVDAHRLAGHIVNYLADDETDTDGDTPNPETLHRVYRETGDIEQAAGAALLDCTETVKADED